MAVAKVCALPGMTQIAGMEEADTLCQAAYKGCVWLYITNTEYEYSRYVLHMLESAHWPFSCNFFLNYVFS